MFSCGSTIEKKLFKEFNDWWLKLVGVGPRCTFVANFYVDFTSCYLPLHGTALPQRSVELFSSHQIPIICLLLSAPLKSSWPVEEFEACLFLWAPETLATTFIPHLLHINNTFIANTQIIWANADHKSMFFLKEMISFQLWGKLKQKQQGFLSYMSFYSEKHIFFSTLNVKSGFCFNQWTVKVNNIFTLIYNAPQCNKTQLYYLVSGKQNIRQRRDGTN